jgi:hypothetical protein
MSQERASASDAKGRNRTVLHMGRSSGFRSGVDLLVAKQFRSDCERS